VSGGVLTLAGASGASEQSGDRNGPSGGGWRVVVCVAVALGLAACTPTSPSQSLSQNGAGLGAGTPHLAPAEIAGLDNMSRTQVIQRLGRPDFTRVDPPAEIWQYRGVSCVLDLFMYPDGSDMRVAHATSRSRQSLQAPADSCSPFDLERTASSG
jgi:hypothetical protein